MTLSRLAGFVLAMVLPVGGTLLAQSGSAGTGGEIEPRFLVDKPIAGMQPGKTIAFDASFYGDGGILAGLSLGLFDRLSLGFSYGGTGLIGDGTPVMNQTPGFAVRFRLLNEGFSVPALVLGFDSQGREAYLKDADRYRIKSPGFYAVASKNYAMLGYLSLHVGVNYSLENADGDSDPNIYAGVEKTIGPFLSVVGEIDFAMNDNSGRALGRGRGYLNFGVSVALGTGVTLSVHAKDLLENHAAGVGTTRSIRLEAVRGF